MKILIFQVAVLQVFNNFVNSSPLTVETFDCMYTTQTVSLNVSFESRYFTVNECKVLYILCRKLDNVV